MYICTCIYKYIHVYMYIHTYTKRQVRAYIDIYTHFTHFTLACWNVTCVEAS